MPYLSILSCLYVVFKELISASTIKYIRASMQDRLPIELRLWNLKRKQKNVSKNIYPRGDEFKHKGILTNFSSSFSMTTMNSSRSTIPFKTNHPVHNIRMF